MSKNLQCVGKFCTIDGDGSEVTFKSNPPNPNLRRLNPNNFPMGDPGAPPGIVSPTPKMRQNPVYQHQRRNDRSGNVVSGVLEKSRLTLIVALTKFQNAGYDYSFVSQYFADCIKTLGVNQQFDTDPLEAVLIFDKDTLKDSAACYQAAIDGIKKIRVQYLTPITDFIDDFASILRND